MRRIVRHRFLLVFSILMLSFPAMAQRISFGLYAAEGITITPLNDGNLNFNTKQPLILCGDLVTINLTDDCYAALRITGRKDQEITVTISAPGTLDYSSSHIPLAVKFAYATNTNAATPEDAKAAAIELPTGFTSVSFPFQRRASGAPIPPPTPAHSGRTIEQASAYLYIYGTLGPVPSNAAAGSYGGTINIHVEYTSN
jgi:hypothetical protein